jgi:hypothetical protein
MELEQLAAVLVQLGCPPEKSNWMAQQLQQRAQMDAQRKGVSLELALQHLVGLMAQGWAAASS